jgi:methyltransferase (TIGR00027 family)
MDEGRPSETAAVAAITPAILKRLMISRKILDDVISRPLDAQSDFYKTRLQRWEALSGPLKLRLKAMVVMRSRFAEDCLAEAFHEGARQFVVLGAGLDTFAYRRPDWANWLRIFDVDYPATQQWKRRLLADAKVRVENGIFVPVDFEKIPLASALSNSGFDSNVATFFSMLGVEPVSHGSSSARDAEMFDRGR